MKDLLKNKKTLIGIIIAIILIVVLAIVIGIMTVTNNAKQLVLLTQEAEKLNNLDIETDEIDMDIKTKGSYAVVEKTMKEYLNDTKVTCTELVDLCTNGDLDKILSAENIKEDGPEFVATKEKLNTFKTKINEYIDKCNTLINEDNINNAINDKRVSEKYKELYRSLMLDEESKNSLNETKQSLNTSAEQINKSLDKMSRILEFLSDNKDSWELVNDKIQFKNISKLTEYYKVINE